MKGKWVLIVEANDNKVVIGPFDNYDHCVNWAERLPDSCGWMTSVLYHYTDYQGETDVQETKA